MNKLQKSTWLIFGLVTVSTVITMLGFVFLAKANAKGIVYIMIHFIVGCTLVPLMYMFLKKNGLERNFDEREKLISRQSLIIATIIMIVFLYVICIFPFFIIGGGSTINIIYLPLICLSAVFTFFFVYSMAVLIQCMLGEENG